MSQLPRFQLLAAAALVAALGVWFARARATPTPVASPHTLEPTPAPNTQPTLARTGTPPTRVSPSPSPTPTPSAAPDEPTLMARLRALGETDPRLSLRLAREANAVMPQSLDAPERAWIIAKALVNLQRFDEARLEARQMVEAYRDTPWALDVERHLLVHPPSDSERVP